MGKPADKAEQEEVPPMFDGSWVQLLDEEESEDSGVESADELSDAEGSEASCQCDIVGCPQESVEDFIRRVHGDDAERILTGYRESPGLDTGMSIGSAESPRGASQPEVPSDTGNDSVMGDSNKENRPRE